MNGISPIQQQERIQVLDILRGISIFGILIVNMGMLNTPSLYLQLVNESMFTGYWDRLADQWITFLAQGKFYTMFSFLFGFGFVLFLERAEQKMERPRLLMSRRLLVLLLIGLIHGYFLWWGDILTTYALGGFLLLAFYHCKPKTVLIWAVSIVLVVVAILLLYMWLISTFDISQSEVIMAESLRQYQTYQDKIAASLYAYGEGTFAEVMSQRIQDLHFAFANIYIAMFLVLPMFLIGVYAAKRKIIQQVDLHRKMIRRVWIWGLVLGVFFNGLKVWSMERMEPPLISVHDIIHSISMIIGDPALCLFYIASVVMLVQKNIWQRWLLPFAHVGRMALSHYLFQSLVLTSIFYSYGFGLYGQVGPLAGLLLSIMIFAFQIAISPFWFRKFQYGPVEWLWRKLTYKGFSKISS